MYFSYKKFLTLSLNELEWGIKIAKVLAASINAVDPISAIKDNVIVKAGNLFVNSRSYNLSQYKNIYVVGAGKAGIPMASAIAEILGDNLSRGIVLVKDDYIGENNSLRGNRISFIEAGHPLPDQRGVRGTKNIVNLLQSTKEDDLVICLISGGGSALLTSPSTVIRLSHLRELMRLLLVCGATINEINTLRKHLENLKGGQFVRHASPASVLSLILSDVVGDPLDVIASGPTVPDTSTFKDAYSILDKYQLIDRIHMSIINHINKGLRREIDETPKYNDPIFNRTQNYIIGSNKDAAQAAMKQAESEGLNTLLLTTYLQGEARWSGSFLASIAKQLRSDYSPVDLPSCVICGGETTVVVGGNGVGGRNTELALGAVELLNGLSHTVLVTLATDGSDGSTDAAGAVVTGDTLQRAIHLDLKPQDYLNNNDSYNFFSQLGDLLKPGPTHTNVNDLAFIFSL
jgi:glycerate 2-kinase